jgi:hypothetical protein
MVGIGQPTEEKKMVRHDAPYKRKRSVTAQMAEMKIENLKFKIKKNTKYKIQNTKYKIQNT